MLNIENLKKIDEGGNRELYINPEKNPPVAVVKLKDLNYTTDEINPESDEFKHRKIELLDTLEAEQILPREVFGRMYIAPRFFNVVVKNGKYFLASYEKYRPDLYPSGSKENVVNLCRVNYSIAVKALFGEKFTNYIAESNSKLQKITESEESIKAVSNYLGAVESYKNSGFRLDLAGRDNVVLANYNDGTSEVVINNSAVKIERIDTLSENLKKVLNEEYDEGDINEIMNQVAGMVNINILCDMVNRSRVFVFDTETEFDLKEVLMGWNGYYIS